MKHMCGGERGHECLRLHTHASGRVVDSVPKHEFVVHFEAELPHDKDQFLVNIGA